MFILSLLLVGLSGQPKDPPASIIPAESDQALSWSCSTQELTKLKMLVIKSSGSRSPDQAWQVVRDYLCGRDASSLARLRRHIPDNVLITHGQQYDRDKSEYVPRAQFLPPKTWAWGANVSSQGSSIRVSYARDEVCSSRVQFMYRGAWLLVSEYNTCD